MAVNTMIECFLRDFVPKYCHRSECSTVYPAPLFWFEFIAGRSHWSLPCLELPMHAEEYFPTLLTSNITIALCIAKAPTLPKLRSNQMFHVLTILEMNKSLCLQRILDFPLLTYEVQYRLVRGIAVKERVPQPVQSKFRTPPPHLC